jgi:two-component system chemotaxis response regulator CheB
MERRDIVVVATSTGGLDALTRLLSAMPADVAAAFFVVMHIGAHPSILPDLLQKSCRLRVTHAVDGEAFVDSTVYLAPPDRHLLIADGKTLLSASAKENFTRPAADPLFRSAAVMYGRRVIGVVLSGDLDDGSAGLRAVRACGGYALVQEPADCRSPGMPANALRAAGADVVAPLKDLGTAILDALESTMSNPRTRNEADLKVAQIEDSMLRAGRSELSELDAIGERSTLTCPDCGGVTWRVGHGFPLRYRCHTGHAFSAASLEEEQSRHLESAIWKVIREIEERIFLTREQIEQESQEGRDPSHLHQRIATLEDGRASALNTLRCTGSEGTS